MKKALAAAVLMAQAAVVSSLVAEPARTGKAAQNASPYMRVYGASPPPFGFVSFCERQPGECTGASFNDPRFEATPARLSELDEVNRRINAAIAPATDQELYGIAEFWTLPSDSGDCEDYALLKRQVLMRKGWPASSLLMTVVRDERGDGHAVLTVRTAQGDYILDNKVNDIRLWHQTGYKFVMRQSFVEPRLWMSLVPEGDDRDGALASTRPRR